MAVQDCVWLLVSWGLTGERPRWSHWRIQSKKKQHFGIHSETSCRTITRRWRWSVESQEHICSEELWGCSCCFYPPKYHQPFSKLITSRLEVFLMPSTGRHDDITGHFSLFIRSAKTNFTLAGGGRCSRCAVIKSWVEEYEDLLRKHDFLSLSRFSTNFSLLLI